MKRGSKKEITITISGLVLPVAWDKNDRVTGVVLETKDEKSYIVDQNKKGKELIGLMHQEVEVKGAVRENELGGLLIKVKNYKPLTPADQDKEVHP